MAATVQMAGTTTTQEQVTEHGVFGVGATATSPLLPGLQVDVAALFATR